MYEAMTKVNILTGQNPTRMFSVIHIMHYRNHPVEKEKRKKKEPAEKMIVAFLEITY